MKECVWAIDDEHEGEVKKRELFSNQNLEVYMCEKHFQEHERIMFLANNQYPIHKVIGMTKEELHKEYCILKLSGVGKEDEK